MAAVGGNGGNSQQTFDYTAVSSAAASAVFQSAVPMVAVPLLSGLVVYALELAVTAASALDLKEHHLE